MSERTSRSRTESGRELEVELLRSIQEMKAGKAARKTIVTPNAVAAGGKRPGCRGGRQPYKIEPLK
jgi:hypothetical protein